MNLTLYADGASRGNPGPASSGAVILDENGSIVFSLGENLGVRTNNYAEYQAVIAGLRHIQSHYPGAQVSVRMDSKLVVEQLSGRWQIKHPELRELATEAHRVMKGLQVSFTWVPREQNTLADAAANRALDEGDFGDTVELQRSAIQPRSIRAPRQSVEPTTLVVIRHGHTALTEANLISGSNGEDPALSALGRSEAIAAAGAAEALLDRFGLGEVSVVYHSPQLRTAETAELIAEHFSTPLVPDTRLREIGFGSWEGFSMADMEASDSALIDSWRGSMSQRPPGGESVSDLRDRVQQAILEIVAQHPGQTVAIVSHMMPLRAIAQTALGAQDSVNWALQFNPASVSLFRFFGSGLAEVFALNACEHLPTK